MLERLDGHLFGADQPCFGCGPNHPWGFHLAFERDGEAVVTRFVPGDRYQGPPGIMHGGLVMTLADEVGALEERMLAALDPAQRAALRAHLDACREALT